MTHPARPSQTDHSAPICDGFWMQMPSPAAYAEGVACPKCGLYTETAIAEDGSCRVALHNPSSRDARLVARIVELGATAERLNDLWIDAPAGHRFASCAVHTLGVRDGEYRGTRFAQGGSEEEMALVDMAGGIEPCDDPFCPNQECRDTRGLDA